MRAIVTGVAGQDGFYLSRLLSAEGFEVLGLTTDEKRAAAVFAEHPCPALTIERFDYNVVDAFSDVLERFKPHLVFNLASLATGQGMFSQPYAMSRVNGGFVLDILEGIRRSPRCGEISFCQASSSEMFGAVDASPQDEDTPFRPKSPYGAAKNYAHSLIGVYRRTHGLRCSSAILYNHESVRRSTSFVTKKIANGAARIKAGLQHKLDLGSLSIARDWGYAPEYVEAMFLMALSATAEDYIVATGRLTTVEDIVRICFDYLALDHTRHIVVNPNWIRPFESVNLCGNPSRILSALGWRARKSVVDMMLEMVDHEVRVCDRV
jgi:GDPmannose 4,6-dehydratase